MKLSEFVVNRDEENWIGDRVRVDINNINNKRELELLEFKDNTLMSIIKVWKWSDFKKFMAEWDGYYYTYDKHGRIYIEYQHKEIEYPEIEVIDFT